MNEEKIFLQVVDYVKISPSIWNTFKLILSYKLTFLKCHFFLFVFISLIFIENTFFFKLISWKYLQFPVCKFSKFILNFKSSLHFIANPLWWKMFPTRWEILFSLEIGYFKRSLRFYMYQNNFCIHLTTIKIYDEANERVFT